MEIWFKNLEIWFKKKNFYLNFYLKPKKRRKRTKQGRRDMGEAIKALEENNGKRFMILGWRQDTKLTPF